MFKNLYGKSFLDRRTALQFGTLALIGACCSLTKTVSVHAAAKPGRTLVLYFSHSGNTAKVAEAMQFRLGADIYELKTTRTYPADYDSVVEVARKEQNANARPELVKPLPDFSRYDIVFLGYPNWWGTLPMCFFTLLEQNADALAGKTIVPFCTHEGSGLGQGPADIRKMVPGARVAAGFEMRGRSVSRAQSSVDDWLKARGYVQ